MTMQASSEQARAIETSGRNLLVSAAAGSGKTYTLVQRIMHHLRTNACALDQLAVVTFTRAAALEMRQRIEKFLLDGAAAQPSLARQLMLLPSADISTLHSFCQSLLRQYFDAIDLDPRFRLAGEQETSLLRDRVMADVFEAAYAKGDPNFLAFADRYGSDRDDEALHGIVGRLYDFSQSQAESEGWLRSLPEAFDLPTGATFAELPWHTEVRDDIVRRLVRVLESARYLSNFANVNGMPDRAEQLAADAERVRPLLPLAYGDDFDGLRAALAALKFPNFSGDKGADGELTKMLRDLRKSEIKEPLTKSLYNTYFAQELAVMLEDTRQVRPTAEALARLALDFTAEFRRVKRKKLIVDFNDLEHLALELLSIDAVAQSVQERYHEVLVDEYQDINGVQEAILRRLSRGDNLFAVGDVKQSIYRFRLADPSLFTEKEARCKADESRGLALSLSDNYRSRREVLAAVNFVFSQLMHAPEMELDYDDRAALYAKSDYPDCAGSFQGQPVELAILPKEPEMARTQIRYDEDGATLSEQRADTDSDSEELKGFAGEARWIAGRLRQLHDARTLVLDPDKRAYRPVQWRDMAVLLRAVKGKAQALVEALRAANVPAYAAVDEGYFDELEVRVVLALLTVIDNARQDIPLAAVLHSPMVGATADELAAIRLGCPEGAFCDAVAASALPKVARFRERLADWRELARRVGVPELLWTLYRGTGYYDYVGAQPGGLVRQANLRMLIDRAGDYEQTNFRGLFRFLQFIRNLRERGTDLAIARTLGENEEVVRVMSVHKSKGLEFPVVVVADLGKSFNLKDTTAEVLVHRELGLGLSRYEQRGTLTWRYPTLARNAIEARLVRESKAEELRTLYVAMTRAREKLILTAHLSRKLQPLALRWCRYFAQPATPIPAASALSANSWLDWVATAVSRDAVAGAPLRDAAGLSNATPALNYPAELYGEPRWRVELGSRNGDLGVERTGAATKAEDTGKLGIEERLRNLEPLPVVCGSQSLADALGWQYPHRLDVPVKVTVSELKRAYETEIAVGMADEHATPLFKGGGDNDFATPRFLSTELDSDAAPAAFGTLMHSVLQRLDLRLPLDESGVRAQLATMPLTDGERRAVDVAAIARWWRGELGQRVLAARQVYREQPFTLALPANLLRRDYPEDERVIVQGVIDLFFVDADGRSVLVDYKTDRHTTPAGIRERYAVQLRLYARALRELAGLSVDEAYIYRLRENDAIPITA